MNTTDDPTVTPPLSLYIHIPFCRFKCYYCDFNTFAGIESLMPAFIRAVTTEIRRWGTATRLSNGIRSSIATVYIGGGTPSLLTEGQLSEVIAAIHDGFQLLPDAEFTMEANPESVTTDAMRHALSLGVNRVSMGAQSFDARELSMLGRLHDSQRIVSAFGEVRNAGFQNVSIDLIYGLPSQTLGVWTRTLERAIELEPDHLSLYALTVEEHTPLHRMVEQEHRFPAPDPDLAADMYEAAQHALKAVGFQQYEISNWSRPGNPSRHNLVYWRNEPFIGVGPGAHSCLRGIRFSDVKQPREYLKRVGAWAEGGPTPTLAPMGPQLEDLALLHAIAPIDQVDPYTVDLERSETLILGLRLSEGVSEGKYASRFGVSPSELYGPELEESISFGLL
ncbi:MAG: radical SAM family heme chaperone HemW [Chloroflexi bacterium]|nr:radical SAM family heme chaperone HemW [Chloroflexota bacterium]